MGKLEHLAVASLASLLVACPESSIVDDMPPADVEVDELKEGDTIGAITIRDDEVVDVILLTREEFHAVPYDVVEPFGNFEFPDNLPTPLPLGMDFEPALDAQEDATILMTDDKELFGGVRAICWSDWFFADYSAVSTDEGDAFRVANCAAYMEELGMPYNGSN